MQNSADALSREDFSRAYESGSAELLRYLLASGMNAEDAQDILHNSFLVLWELRGKISPADALKPMWFTVARHKVVDFFRKNRRLKPLPPDLDNMPDRAAAPGRDLDNDYLRGRIADALAALPEDIAECYKLAKISGISLKETANILDITEAVVKSRIFRARRKLMKALSDLWEFL